MVYHPKMGVFLLDLLNDLNPSQFQAVTHGDGPLLIIAGAGSGKTRVLTYRVAYLIAERGVSPSRLLAVTFTNKAADEMRERIINLIGNFSDTLWIGTFHSICLRILKRYASRIGYTSNFSIADTSDQLALIRKCLKELNLDAERFDPKGVLASISWAKNECRGPEEYSQRAGDFWERTVARVYQLYQQKLFQAKSMDFDDLLMNTLELFKKDQDVLSILQNQFDHILIDEYQDTNRVQYLLVKKLAEKHRNICVVGDADQSIYRFRGADITNILNFRKHYPEAMVVKLEENYRSTKTILEAANHLIKNNLGRLDKTLYTNNPDGEKITVYQARDEKDEASFICREIKRLYKRGKSLKDFALLYRTHAQSRALEEELLKEGIKYHIIAGLKFYDRKEIKDLIAYLRLVANPLDDLAFERIINVPRRGVGDVSLSRMKEYALSKGISLYQTLEHIDELDLNKSTRNKLMEFGMMIEDFQGKANSMDLTALTEKILQDSGYLEMLNKEKTQESQSRVENLMEFMSVTVQFSAEHEGAGLEDLLEQVALVSDVDVLDEKEDAVKLLTMHSAKGLEFPVVFMVGMEQGLFPHSRSFDDEEELEEERRLCYVGITRAKELLYLTHARMRTIFGRVSANMASTFVEEIPQKFLEMTDQIRALTPKKETVLARNRTTPPADMTGVNSVYRVGQKIRHPVFGNGIIVQIEAKEDTILTLAFEQAGIKKIATGYVELTILN
jgi:DNA helicase-2/ATP-dependent DNA helicase PcrA